jgi:hypothetical protein
MVSGESGIDGNTSCHNKMATASRGNPKKASTLL